MAAISARHIPPSSAARWDGASFTPLAHWIRDMPVILLRAFSALLSYPTADMREALPEIAAAIDASPLVGAGERRGLAQLIAELAEGDLLAAEARYVDLFDRGRALSLHLFEH